MFFTYTYLFVHFFLASSAMEQHLSAQPTPLQKSTQTWDEFVKNFDIKNWQHPKKKEDLTDGDTTKENEECEDLHPECKNHTNLCEKETYAVMMLYLCPKSCSFCEARKHFPDSGLDCTDHTPKCIRKSMRDKCKTDKHTQDLCPWACGTC